MNQKIISVKEGILIIATGEKYRKEAIKNVQLIRPKLNGRPITLVTDEPHKIPPNLFEKIKKHPDISYSYRDKIPPLMELPYARTIFLDTDLELLQPIDDLFQILRALDVIGCHAPVRWCQWRDPIVPEGFCELNSGVLGLRRSSRVRALIKRWLHVYDLAGVPFDQASLRSALWWASNHRRVRSWILPPEYNLRTPKPWLAGAGMSVKILHGRIKEEIRESLKNYLNSNTKEFRSSSSFPTELNQQVLPFPFQINKK